MQTVKLIVIILCVFLVEAGSSFEHKFVVVQSGEGFLLFGSQDNSTPPQICNLTRNNEVISFIPGIKKQLTLSNGEMVNILQKSDCGLRVFNSNSDSDGEWVIASFDGDGNQLSLVSTWVTFLQENKNHCPRNTKCTMTNLDTKVEESCGDTNWENYKCEFLTYGKMRKSSLEFHNIQEKPDFSPVMVVESGSNIFECNLNTDDHNLTLSECYLEHVSTGREYLIYNGLQDMRYSSYKTNIGSNVCQFEIPKDILEDELGVWKITLVADKLNGEDNEKSFQSCKFRLEGNLTEQQDRLRDRTNSIIEMETFKEKETIKCADNIYYPIHVCYIVHSDGELLFSDNYDELEAGTCEFEVPPGNWTCGFNGPTIDDEDFSQSFEVVQKKEIIDEGFTNREGGPTLLECHLTNKMPLKMCIFVSPSERVYRLPSDRFKSDSYSYYLGGNWTTGDCGIEFENIENLEQGNWKCIIGKMDGEMLTTTILVD